jgi:hypothetical protein
MANASPNARSQSSRASAYRIDRNSVTAIRQGEPGGWGNALVSNMVFHWSAACEHQPNDQHQYCFHLCFPSWLWPDHLPSGNQKRFERDPVKRAGRTIWIVDAHRDGRHFIVKADEKLTGFLELESAIRATADLNPREKAMRLFQHYDWIVSLRISYETITSDAERSIFWVKKGYEYENVYRG